MYHQQNQAGFYSAIGTCSQDENITVTVPGGYNRSCLLLSPLLQCQESIFPLREALRLAEHP